MTHGYETMNRFIDSQIESINHTLKYTTENRANWNDRMGAIEYVQRSIETEKDQGFGALIYAKIYERTITDDEFDELTEKLREAFYKAREKAFEVIR